jgi:hypothetical protein
MKKIINTYFSIKNYLKNNCYYTAKYSFYQIIKTRKKNKNKINQVCVGFGVLGPKKKNMAYLPNLLIYFILKGPFFFKKTIIK